MLRNNHIKKNRKKSKQSFCSKWSGTKLYFYSCLIKAVVTCQNSEKVRAIRLPHCCYSSIEKYCLVFFTYSILLSVLKPCRAVFCCTIKMKSAMFLLNSHYCVGELDFLCKRTQHATIKIVNRNNR